MKYSNIMNYHLKKIKQDYKGIKKRKRKEKVSIILQET
jgi:hypothetical protein